MGIKSVPMQANATPQRPSESNGLYDSNESVVISSEVNAGSLAFITTYGSPLNAGMPSMKSSDSELGTSLGASDMASGSSEGAGSGDVISSVIVVDSLGSVAPPLVVSDGVPQADSTRHRANNRGRRLFFNLVTVHTPLS